MRKPFVVVRPRAVALFALALLTITWPPGVYPQRRNTQRAPRTAGAPRNARDADIARMLAEVDARNIERTIRKLVSFGTRNTLSAQDDPARGIGAARDWLFSEFQKIAVQSDGRMTVEKQSYLQEAQPPPRGRVPKPTIITNVVATLKGTQPES